jgi:hypothetical protein
MVLKTKICALAMITTAEFLLLLDLKLTEQADVFMFVY